eukprot:GHVT01105065.1.p1 GENE.GHVT01105065.1~~GHVT01105065.1.p1  ORF type:complete len:294 (+),score=71.03 GHVT01105065.1:661-1542(+)
MMLWGLDRVLLGRSFAALEAQGRDAGAHEGPTRTHNLGVGSAAAAPESAPESEAFEEETTQAHRHWLWQATKSMPLAGSPDRGDARPARRLKRQLFLQSSSLWRCAPLELGEEEEASPMAAGSTLCALKPIAAKPNEHQGAAPHYRGRFPNRYLDPQTDGGLGPSCRCCGEVCALGVRCSCFSLPSTCGCRSSLVSPFFPKSSSSSASESFARCVAGEEPGVNEWSNLQFLVPTGETAAPQLVPLPGVSLGGVSAGGRCESWEEAPAPAPLGLPCLSPVRRSDRCRRGAPARP